MLLRYPKYSRQAGTVETFLNLTHPRLYGSRWLAAAALALSPALCTATVLTFDEARSATGQTVGPVAAGDEVPFDYGDNVTGSPMNVSGGQYTYGNAGEGYTPNVVVDFFTDTGTSVNIWTLQYGDLENVAIAHAPLSGVGSPQNLNIRLTADPGYQVQLWHFDMAGWANADYTIDGVSVLDDGGAVFEQTQVLIEGDFTGPRHTAFDFSSPLTAQQLTIQVDFSNMAASIRDNIGIDNIRFGQTPPAPIPLPASMVLFGSGLLALLLGMRIKLKSMAHIKLVPHTSRS